MLLLLLEGCVMMFGKDKEMVVVATNGYCPPEPRKGDVEQSHANKEKEKEHVNLNGSKTSIIIITLISFHFISFISLSLILLLFIIFFFVFSAIKGQIRKKKYKIPII